jgi:D-alanyl-D-alanine endopeptidase (penicillin-binding protein 7)
MLAAFVFFSANTVYFLEDPRGPVMAAAARNYAFDFDKMPQAKKPNLNLKAAILVNYGNGEVLYAKNVEQPRPIASITKLVMAMVLLDRGVDLSTTATITKEDAHRSSKSRLNIGYEMTLEDLLYAALLNSDNRAARALARSACGTIGEFVREMNLKARQLGLKNTVFYEPTGLDSRNVSTAHEVAKILHYAYDHDLIAKITSTRSRTCTVLNRKNKRLQMANTNLIIHSRYSVLGGKTGYTRASDYCLTTLVSNKSGERLTCVVLGVPGDRLRFKEARRLLDWGFLQLKNRDSSTALVSKS